MPVNLSLSVDSDGFLWLTQDIGDDSRTTLLGPVADAATSYHVPGELLDELGRLEAEWAEAVGFAVACRIEAMETYRRNVL